MKKDILADAMIIERQMITLFAYQEIFSSFGFQNKAIKKKVLKCEKRIVKVESLLK